MSKEHDIVYILKHMKLHPGMFIRKPSIFYLESFLGGYLCSEPEDYEKLFFEELNNFYNFYYIAPTQMNINYAHYLIMTTNDEEKAFTAFFENLDKFYDDLKRAIPTLQSFLNAVDSEFPDKNVLFDDNYKTLYNFNALFEQEKTFYGVELLIDIYDQKTHYEPSAAGDFCNFVQNRTDLINQILKAKSNSDNIKGM